MDNTRASFDVDGSQVPTIPSLAEESSPQYPYLGLSYAPSGSSAADAAAADSGVGAAAKAPSRHRALLLVALLATALTAGGVGYLVAWPQMSALQEDLHEARRELQLAQSDVTRGQERIDDLMADNSALEEQVGTVEEREAQAERKEQEAEKRTGELDAREADLVTREQAVGAAEQQIAVNSFGTGTKLVGADIEPGTYRNDATSGMCYWERLNGTGGELQDIIANNISEGTSIVEIAASDVAFNSSGCGTWTLVP